MEGVHTTTETSNPKLMYAFKNFCVPFEFENLKIGMLEEAQLLILCNL